MKFSQFGYQTKEIKVREMSIGSILLTAAQQMIENEIKDIDIKIIDTFVGEVDVYHGLDELLSHDWNHDYSVNLYDVCVMHDNITDKDFLKIVIADEL